jgi:ankyrin repeat protein
MARILFLLSLLLAAGLTGCEAKPDPESSGPAVNRVDSTGKQLGLLLIDAARVGDRQRVLTLLERGADVRTQEADGTTVLHAFFSRRNWKLETGLLDILLKHGADPEARDASGRTTVHLAAERGRQEAMKRLLAESVDVHRGDESGSRPLHLAAARGNIETLVLLVSAGADLEAKDNTGRTPLRLAEEKGEVETGWLLVSLGADMTSADDYGHTPAPWLVRSCVTHLEKAIRADTLSALDALDQTICVQNGPLKSSCLQFAAMRGEEDLVRLLLRKGANPDVGAFFDEEMGVSGARPLHAAARGGHLEIARLLLKNGAEVEPRDANGWTPLHWSAWKNHREMAVFLIENGALPGRKNREGSTPVDLVPAEHRASWTKALRR